MNVRRYRRFGLSLLLCGVLCLTPGAVASPMGGPDDPPVVKARIEASVNRVITGDALDAHVGGRRTAVGYLGAEAPFPHQPCGQEALMRSRQLVGDRILLEEDPAYTFDAIGRRLYYVHTAEGTWVEEALVREGLARAVRTDAGRGARLLELQAEAEAAGRGCLWGSG